MASDFFDDSLDDLLSPGQDDDDFDPGELIPKHLDRGRRDLLALGAALNAPNHGGGHVRHGGEGGARQAPLVVLAHAEMLREGDGEAGDEQAFRSDILQLEHILHVDED